MTEVQWRDWKWQMRSRIRSIEELRGYLPSIEKRPGLEQVANAFPLSITPYYLSLIRQDSPDDPIYRMAVPDPRELEVCSYLRSDPLDEEEDMPVPNLVHRYPDRALMLVSEICAMYCRHCTRKRFVGRPEVVVSGEVLAQQVAYLRAHPEVTDVILSGGDPLVMGTSTLERILSAVRSVPTVEVIRIGTRAPVVMPMRVTDELTAMLEKYHPLWINTHFNHPNEITPEAEAACARLSRAGIPLGNQIVLLRGVNDAPETIESLCRDLIRMRVRPYYLFQCDLVRGVEHFRTSLSRGIEIMEHLRGRIAGFAIPQFTVDAPGGGGKIPVLPNYILSQSPTHTVLRNFEGVVVSYPEPATRERARLRRPSERGGVAGLLAGKVQALIPEGTERLDRRRRIHGPRNGWEGAGPEAR